MTLSRILIANRGEIAVRIIRACHDTGRTALALYSDADAQGLHVRLADEAYPLGGISAAESYLDAERIVALAVEAGADAVHPGYGFLSESADFARLVLDAGLGWIGPPPEAIRALGDKVSARDLARQVGAPLVAGTEGPLPDADAALAFARENGLPIAIKAAHGGGGRGMRIAWELEEVPELYEAAVREAKAAFGRGECFAEQYLDRPRHVEVQVLADAHGAVAALGTRDCSLQRRNQKLVEEAPAPGLTPEQNRAVLDSAAAVCREAGYIGAGTVEFLLGTDGTLSFLEVNTRLQVEHPVTEETTGLDLVAWQLAVAQGQPLGPEVLLAAEAARDGEGIGAHAIEFRINAEDPGRGFLPSPGEIETFTVPLGPGVRVDSGYMPGDVLPGAYDSMLAKLIVTGRDRPTALARARRALGEFEVSGVATVLPFHRTVVEHPDFAGEDLNVHTRWIETEPGLEFAPEAASEPAEESGVVRTWIEIDGRRRALGLPRTLLAGLGGLAGGAAEDGEAAGADDAGPGAVLAPVTGTLASWLVDDGAEVEQGQRIAVLEAMKMETPLEAAAAGTLQIAAEAGASVTRGEAIGRIG